MQFLLNGELQVCGKDAASTSAAAWIRQRTCCKSVKLSCQEGGCGACAIQVVPARGGPPVALNGCLVPVAALHGAAVLTSEGLGNSRDGYNVVQARLAAFHATQCGFCSPGVAVACHAALSKAAHRACDGAAAAGSCGGAPGTSANGSALEASASISANELLSALDGNLCRCTGWRPIADMARSFACDVDMEDLGLNSLAPQQLGPVTSTQLRAPQASCARPPQPEQQQQQQFDAALQQLDLGCVLAPASLPQLLQALRAAHAAQLPVHLVAGNTGAGVYKEQWRSLAASVCVLLQGVTELQQVAVHWGSPNGSSNGNRINGSGNGSSNGSGNGSGNGSSNGGVAVLTAGAGVTLTQLLEALDDAAAAAEAEAAGSGAQGVRFMAAHVRRIAGTLVRNAAMLGGHLALARGRRLESDLATICVAAGAQVCLARACDGASHWLLLEDFLASDGGGSKQAAELLQQFDSGRALVTALRLPLPLQQPAAGSTSFFWSHKLTVHRHSNEHPVLNTAVWLAAPAAQAGEQRRGSFKLRVAVGTYQRSATPDRAAWRCTRARAVEAAVLEALEQPPATLQHGLADVLSRLPELVQQDVQAAGRHVEFVRSAAPGLLLKGLAAVLRPLLQQVPLPADAAAGVLRPGAISGGGSKRSSGSSSLEALQELHEAAAADLAAGPGAYRGGKQELPIDLQSAPPLYWPTAKDGAELQASGEAIYADDTPLQQGALHAAYVTSTVAHARLLEVDTSAALRVEGVVAILGPHDIPAGPGVMLQPPSLGPPQPLFAHTHVTYHGQALGLVVATSPEAAEAGAAAVRVAYGPVEESSSAGAAPALTSLAAAARAESYWDLAAMHPASSASKGDVAAALDASSRVLTGRVHLGSQRHAYMEPQTAIATPEEGGCLAVVSSCQGCDQVMLGISRALGLPHNQIHVTARRVGGGFGGKVEAAAFHAASAALAAHKLRRQVRLVVPQSVDTSMRAGRCPMELDFTAGVDDTGRLTALKLHATLLDGAFAGGVVEATSMRAALDGVYAIPAFAASLRVARAHLPPRSTVRGPGKVSAALLLELTMQRIATLLGASPDEFRQRHIIQLPQAALAAAARAEAEAAAAQANGADSEQLPPPLQGGRQPRMPHPKFLPADEEGGADGLATALGAPLALRHYTLPYMWQCVQQRCDYEARRAEVDAFNAQHSFKKRGLALVPARYFLGRGFQVARVSVYMDGSVLLSHGGVDIGQGIGTKVKQTAAHALGQLLPLHERADLLARIRVAGGSTQLLPHAGLAAGSTTSEGACAAVASACGELVERLQPMADGLAAAGEEVSWSAIIAACGRLGTPFEFLTTKVLLTAVARGGFGPADGFGMYHSYGAGAAEVELDLTTGERRLLRCDIMFDAGRTISPAIDLGQVEGAFMQGVGYVMTEEVVEDEATGATLTGSTWTYKPPGLAELPQVFNVHLLRDSPCHVPNHQQLSAKATGEPPMMLSAAVACALQDAVNAAWRDHAREAEAAARGEGGAGPEAWPVLRLPATTAQIKAALPPVLLRAPSESVVLA